MKNYQLAGTAGLGICVGLCLFLSGCGGPRAAAVNESAARTALVATLDQWKAGGTPESLLDGESITVQDLDWTNGFRLVSYEVNGDGALDDANLRCPVKLTLEDPQGNKVERDVVYIVGTDPVTTVFREWF